MFHRICFPQSKLQSCYCCLRAEPGVPNIWKHHPRKSVKANMINRLLQEGSLAILHHDLKLFLIIHWTLHITRLCRHWSSADLCKTQPVLLLPLGSQDAFRVKAKLNCQHPANLGVFDAGSNLQAPISLKCRSTSPSSLSSISPPNSCLQTTPETGRRLSNFHNFHTEMLESFLFPSWTLL